MLGLEDLIAEHVNHIGATIGGRCGTSRWRLPAAQATGFATCDSGPREGWQPQDKLSAMLKEKGWQVRRIKEDGGCYEVYAVDDKGQRTEVVLPPAHAGAGAQGARRATRADLPVKVWDRFVRVAHWSLAACVLAAWITAEVKLKSAEPLHEWLGYAALGVIALRVAYGLDRPALCPLRPLRRRAQAPLLAYAKAGLRGVAKNLATSGTTRSAAG
jgi:hypothetical protein